jgi:hypothetical protein
VTKISSVTSKSSQIATSLVVVVSACQVGDVESDSVWVPRVVVDAERQISLDLIYNYTDIELVSMLRMHKALFQLMSTIS